MNSASSNKESFNPLKRLWRSVLLANSLSINTKTLIATGNANSSVITDVLIRNTSTSSAVLFDVWIGANNTDSQNNRVQISVPANAGNNGVVAIASLASLVPALFDNNIAGDRCIFLEDATWQIWIENKAALGASGACFVTVKQHDFS